MDTLKLLKSIYTLKPLRVGPSPKKIISYIVYSPDGDILAFMKTKEDADKLLRHLNREDL